MLIPVIFLGLILYWKRDLLMGPNDPTEEFLDKIVESRQNKDKEKTIHKIEDSDFSDELYDFHPKSWLKKYRQTSFTYLCKMGLFYSVIGLIMAFTVYYIQFFAFGYEEPTVNVSLLTAILAGPLEETVFFGIPYALSGNHYVVLATGFLWSISHLFNATEVGGEGVFSTANLAFTLSHVFFSLRTWKSGKGWFAIFFHSAWNAVMISISMAVGEMPLIIIDTTLSGMMEIGLVVLSFNFDGYYLSIIQMAIKT